jgi:hypothetical protein
MAVIIAMILFIGTASADNIKGVKKEEVGGTLYVKVTTDNTVSQVTINGNQLSVISSNGEKKWEKDITPTIDNGISEIQTSGGSKRQVNGKDMGNGGCPNRNSYESHATTYSLARVDLIYNNLITTYHLDTDVDPSHPENGIIGICIYPKTFNNPELNLLYSPDWEIKQNTNWDYFGFGRAGGNSLNIKQGTDGDLGTAKFLNNIPLQQDILLHIFNPRECSPEGEDTCWRRPGYGTPIPEFPTIALPIAAVIGLVFFFQHKKRKEE